jgi:hypothetical protein
MVSDQRSPLTRRCSGRYASAAPTVFADSNHRAPGPLRGTRSAAELQIVGRRSTAIGPSIASHLPGTAEAIRAKRLRHTHTGSGCQGEYAAPGSLHKYALSYFPVLFSHVRDIAFRSHFTGRPTTAWPREPLPERRAGVRRARFVRLACSLGASGSGSAAPHTVQAIWRGYREERSKRVLRHKP